MTSHIGGAQVSSHPLLGFIQLTVFYQQTSPWLKQKARVKIHHNNAYKHEQQNNEQPQHNTGGMRGLKLTVYYTVLHPSTSIILANIFLQKLHLKRKCTH